MLQLIDFIAAAGAILAAIDLAFINGVLIEDLDVTADGGKLIIFPFDDASAHTAPCRLCDVRVKCELRCLSQVLEADRGVLLAVVLRHRPNSFNLLEPRVVGGG